MSLWQGFARLIGFGEVSSTSQSASVEDSHDLESGQVVGEYVIEHKLGEGGFGAVYRAVHPVIGKAAAVKVLHPQYSSNPEMVSRFVSEARAVNQIRHRHIIDIFSFGSLRDGRHYYVMELLEGVALDAYLEQVGRLGLREALPLLHAVAKALEAAHDAGIAHRDLKPENIFLAVDDDGTAFPKLLDFGVAKLLTESGASPMHKTHTGTPIGTPRYMSPEQCQGRKVDHRTDIYSFGVIAHRVLTGSLPFEATTALELMLMHVGTPPPKLSEVVDDIDAVMDEPVLRMLEKDPQERPSSVSDAFDALRAAAAVVGVTEDERVSISPDILPAINEAKSASRRSDRAPPGAVQTPAHATSSFDKSKPGAVRPNGRLVLAGAAIGVTSAVIALFVSSRPSEGSSAQKMVASTFFSFVPMSAPVAPVAAPPSSSYAVVAPAPPVSVSWTFETQPEAAEVFLGKKRLGVAPGPFKVKRSDAERSVTIKAPGYHEEELHLNATGDRTISVQLKRHSVRLPNARPSVPKDLEYPF